MKYLCKPLIRCFLERSEALFLFFETDFMSRRFFSSTTLNKEEKLLLGIV